MNHKLRALFQAIFPIALYYIITEAMALVLVMFGVGDNNWMLRQLLCYVVNLPLLIYWYKRTPRSKGKIYGWKWLVLLVIMVVAFSVFGNNMIELSGIKSISNTFQSVSTSIYSKNIYWQIALAVICAPIMEELIYRGIVYNRVKTGFSARSSMVISAFLFGVLHGNIVQLAYAFILGWVLAYVYEKSGKLWLSILGHIAANGVAIVSTNLGWTDWMFAQTGRCLILGCITGLIGAAIIAVVNQQEATQ